jgi:hypothetical protein
MFALATVAIVKILQTVTNVFQFATLCAQTDSARPLIAVHATLDSRRMIKIIQTASLYVVLNA